MDEQTYADATIQMPEQASTLAPEVDALYYDIFWISVVFFVGIVGAMVWFAWKYRRRKGVTSKPPGHHNALELFWTFSPLILLAYMFHQGFESFMTMAVPPENSINVRVEAYQWGWRFEQPNGLVESELWVPQNEPVRLIMASVPRSAEQPAVLHSFFIPAFRVKRDVVPGMYTSLWFEATRQGTYDIFCTEYCGLDLPQEGQEQTYADEDLHVDGRPTAAAGHSGMLSRVHVVTRQEWEDHLEEGFSMPDEYDAMEDWGEQLFSANGCTACHVVQAGAGATVGPNLANVAGYDQPLIGAPAEMADVDYLRESIREPQAKIVEGYGSAAMPSFGSLPELQIDALVAYIGSLSDQGGEVVEAMNAAQQAEGE
ncbi:MAG TPA: cytochrome c oxidase subunit II [Sandaracinaceae bacterium LLY-WYZ-13_1]|nr:cytochrome c oxidase subunit II [Sandaracinaceae bacterium LLY-WYZ-13_1]